MKNQKTMTIEERKLFAREVAPKSGNHGIISMFYFEEDGATINSHIFNVINMEDTIYYVDGNLPFRNSIAQISCGQIDIRSLEIIHDSWVKIPMTWLAPRRNAKYKSLDLILSLGVLKRCV